MAHLTHPLGVIASISYSLFLLLKKEFRGALIVFARLSQALGAYNKANFLPDKDYTDKIEELKNKLES